MPDSKDHAFPEYKPQTRRHERTPPPARPHSHPSADKPSEPSNFHQPRFQKRSSVPPPALRRTPASAHNAASSLLAPPGPHPPSSSQSEAHPAPYPRLESLATSHQPACDYLNSEAAGFISGC